MREEVATDWAGRRVVAIADFDSFLRVAKVYGDMLAKRGAELDYRIAWCRGGQLSADQIASCGLDQAKIGRARLSGLAMDPTVQQADVILLALNGARSRQFLVDLHRRVAQSAKRRPVLVSFYPGILFRFHLEGMMSRSTADLLLLNSQHDLDLYRAAVGGAGLNPNNAVATGLAMLPSAAEIAGHCVPPDGDILFVGQPTVPSGRVERMYTAKRLVELAWRFPDRRIVLKPRHRPNETTLHRTKFHFEDMVRALECEVPANFELSYSRMPDLLRRASVVLTYSSTAAIESAIRGIPTRVLTDLGVHENIGNQFFLGSGLFGSFDDVTPDVPGVLDHGWKDQHVRSAADHVEVFLARLDALLTEQASRGEPLPTPNPGLFSRSEAFEQFVVRRFGAAALADFGHAAKGESKAALAKRQWQHLRSVVGGFFPKSGLS